MQYLNRSFTLSTTTKAISQEQWDLAFGLSKPTTPKRPHRKKAPRAAKTQKQDRDVD